MSSVTIEWVTTGIFALCFIAAIIVEALWLIRKGWASAQKSVAYVMLTNNLSLCIGFFIPFVIIGTMLALAWSGDLSGVSGGDATLIAAIVIALLFPPVFLFLMKRVFLAFFKIRTGREAWLYSLAFTTMSLGLSFIPPIAFFYIASKVF
jgi:hypothetical protein